MDLSTPLSPTTDASLVRDSAKVGRTREEFLHQIEDICVHQLRPQVRAIDIDGHYPADVMHKLGDAGLYAQHLSGAPFTGRHVRAAGDMPLAIEAMALVGYECLSTAFCVWCHDACGWYLENTTNRQAKDAIMPLIASGARLGGTGLSNPMKFFSNIEKIKLVGRRVDGGYVVNGCLPWVSNLGPDHYFGLVFGREDQPSQRIMGIVPCDLPGVKLCDGGRFIALEGSGTFAIRLKDCFIDDSQILADPADDYINQIRPGFVLMQVGMAIGHVRACADLMHRQDRTHSHVNCFLPDQASQLGADADELLSRTMTLAQTPHENSPEFMIQALQARLDAGELSLRAAQACMLNGGARAYMEKSNQFRKLREAYFVGVVTPATKHLRKEITRLKAIAS